VAKEESCKTIEETSRLVKYRTKLETAFEDTETDQELIQGHQNVLKGVDKKIDMQTDRNKQIAAIEKDLHTQIEQMIESAIIALKLVRLGDN
jgi:hypothetical protein